MLTDEKIQWILKCAHSQIDSEISDKNDQLMIKMGVWCILDIFSKEEAPIFDPRFVLCMRKAADVIELLVQENKK